MNIAELREWHRQQLDRIDAIMACNDVAAEAAHLKDVLAHFAGWLTSVCVTLQVWVGGQHANPDIEWQVYGRHEKIGTDHHYKGNTLGDAFDLFMAAGRTPEPQTVAGVLEELTGEPAAITAAKQHDPDEPF